LKTLELQSRILVLFGLACIVFLLVTPLPFFLAHGVGVTCIARNGQHTVPTLRCYRCSSGSSVVGKWVKVIARLDSFFSLFDDFFSLLIESFFGSLRGSERIDVCAEFDDLTEEIGRFLLPIAYRLCGIGVAW
jgi:hypothetical protein